MVLFAAAILWCYLSPPQPHPTSRWRYSEKKRCVTTLDNVSRIPAPASHESEIKPPK